jgi:Short C-terminal domain
VFGHNKRLERKLKEEGGQRAWATVLESEQEWASTGGINKAAGQAGSMTIHQRFKLRVEPEGEAPFEGDVKQVFNDTHGWHIPDEGYSVTVIYDPDDHSKLVIDLEKMPVVPGVDRDGALARHERAMARAQDPEARRQRSEEIKAAQEAARAQGAAALEGAAAIQEMVAKATAQAQGAAAAPDVADQLTKLADLRDRGALTEAEFEAQKAKLLGAS